jgi:hypothetical protein
MPLSSTSSSTADLSRTAAKFKVGGRLCHAGIILLDVGRRASQGV